MLKVSEDRIAWVIHGSEREGGREEVTGEWTKLREFNLRYPNRVSPVNHRGCWSCSQLLSLSLSLSLSLCETP